MELDDFCDAPFPTVDEVLGSGHGTLPGITLPVDPLRVADGEDLDLADVFDFLSAHVVNTIVSSRMPDPMPFIMACEPINEGGYWPEVQVLLASVVEQFFEPIDMDTLPVDELAESMASYWGDQGIEIWPEVISNLLHRVRDNKPLMERPMLVSPRAWVQHVACVIGMMTAHWPYMDVWRIVIDGLDSLKVMSPDGDVVFLGRNYWH